MGGEIEIVSQRIINHPKKAVKKAASKGETIGCMEYAEMAREIHSEGWRRNIPNGWKELGSGCFRTAFLAPDGIVYKVEARGGHYNPIEYQVFLAFADKMPEGVSLSPCFFYGNGVLAMELATGDETEWGLPTELRQEIIRITRDNDIDGLGAIRDLHGGNCRRNADGSWTLIDYSL
jgi:hypothetical protein